MAVVNAVDNIQRVLGRVSRQDFVGRAEELDRVVVQANRSNHGRGLLLLLEPSAGVSELLRQAYDQIFSERSDVIPIYFAFTRNETTAVSAAIEFLTSFLQQYIAFRRNEPAISQASLTLQDLVELAPSTDREWIDQLWLLYDRIRFSNDNKELVRFCFGAPQRVPARAGRPFVMLDGSQLAEYLDGGVVLGTEAMRVFARSGLTFVIAGLRRQILDAAHKAECDFESLDTLKLEQLNDEDGRLLVSRVAQRQQVPTSQEAEALIVQQFGGSPNLISIFLQAAREKNTALISYLDCERLYVDELLGGHLYHHYQRLLEEMGPQLEPRLKILRVLSEAAASEERAVSTEAWRKRLHLTSSEFESVMHQLHIQEFVNWNGPIVDPTTGPQTWKDFLKTQYRLDVIGEPRALVVADTLSDSLKRAPHTMASHYKDLAQLELRTIASQFNCQRVPAALLDYARFKESYKGQDTSELASALDSDTELIHLPQTIHVASSIAFNRDMRHVTDEEKCVVVHAFDDGVYKDDHEVIWLVAEIDSKLEVGLDLTEIWYERLDSLARVLGFRRYQVWLISNEGFTEEANELLRKQEAYSSSRRQLELLIARIGEPASQRFEQSDVDEFLMVVPMGEDNELIAASTVEHIARRLPFDAGAINQIKTAIVEACINASEHSFSPERKIYQRFRVESDKLVVTISSRGILPTNIGSGNEQTIRPEIDPTTEERRGWGLRLIRSLMDEVEFENVDEGTSLKMTKYLRNRNN